MPSSNSNFMENATVDMVSPSMFLQIMQNYLACFFTGIMNSWLFREYIILFDLLDDIN